MDESSNPRPDPYQDLEYARLIAEGKAARERGEPKKVFSRFLLAAARRKRALNFEWRKSLPPEDQAGERVRPIAGGRDPLETGAIDKSIFMAVEFSPRAMALLMRLAEGIKCSCCKSCRVTVPDLKAIATITGLLQDAMRLRMAQIEARRNRRQKAEVVEIGWAADGDKA